MTNRDSCSRRAFLGGVGGLLFVPWWLRAGGGTRRWAPAGLGRRPLEGFGTASVSVRDGGGVVREACVLVADTFERREQGLMRVQRSDIRGYAGMLFVFPFEGVKAFYMRNTPMPLSIAFFAADGAFVSSHDMEPCGDRDDCPTTTSAGRALYALEVPQGMLPALGIGTGSTLTLGGRCGGVRA